MTGIAVDVVLDAKYNSGGGGDANNNGRSQIGACVCDRRTVKNEFCLKFGVMVVDVGLTMMGMSDLLLPPLLSSSSSNALPSPTTSLLTSSPFTKPSPHHRHTTAVRRLTPRMLRWHSSVLLLPALLGWPARVHHLRLTLLLLLSLRLPIPMSRRYHVGLSLLRLRGLWLLLLCLLLLLGPAWGDVQPPIDILRDRLNLRP